MKRVAISSSVRCNSDLETALATVSRLGSTTIDLLAIDGWVHVHPSTLAAEFETAATDLDRRLTEHRLTPIALNTGVGPQLHDRSEEANHRRIAETTALLDLMDRNDIPAAAIQPRNHDPNRPYADVLRDCVASLREQQSMAEARNKTFALELHVWSPFETPEQAALLFETWPEVPLVYDPTHFIMAGVPLRETEAYMSRARHCHLRDAAPGKLQTPLGEGAVDFDWVFGALEDAGYQGRFSIEYLETHDFDVDDSARRLFERVAQRFAS